MTDVILFGKPYTRQGAARLFAAGPSPNMAPDLFYLEFFWARFPEGAAVSAEEKVRLLRTYAGMVFRFRTKPVVHKRIREHFNRNFRDEQDDRPCFVCGNRFNHRHHIIQIQHGGRNRKRNLVLLCRECHSLVHKGLMPIPLTNTSGTAKPTSNRKVRARDVKARVFMRIADPADS